MKRKLKELMDYTIITRDGLSAVIKDFLFDTQKWNIQYFQILFKKNNKNAILPITFFKYAQIINNQVFVDVLESEIGHFIKKNDSLPLIMKYEEKLLNLFNNRINTADQGLNTASFDSNEVFVRVDNRKLISFNELTKFNINANNGTIGKIDDLIVENDWNIIYFILYHNYKIPLSKKGLLDVHYLKNISFNDISVDIDMPNEKVRKVFLFMTENESALVDLE